MQKRAWSPDFRKWRNVLDLHSARGSMTPSIRPNSQDCTPRKDGFLSTSVTAQWHRLRCEEVRSQSFGGLRGGSVVRTPRLHGRRHRFNPRLENQDPTCRRLGAARKRKGINRSCSVTSTFPSSDSSCASQPPHRRCCSCRRRA